ncbi:GspK family T2SS minor pseudopilin variant LspK [Legionella sp. PATHC032]|uniref:GspK family T2SS minor pseudopilin variant LspK n=1 Tax=Legionella sp. PATHC032 TaxID=2992039 RepID=UPI001B20605E|nr:GspK family T2SS minor pseudopilin variant LspK [Legionella sp. PATHC032]MCW8421232.1 GspK family T2SS minor pseudopilin variant LspK [Legionella sp. PATHC032]HAZ7573067.1 GspK family T2SS minor pseudopilin variant LspK [Legionella pneumophila]HBA1635760.1 GspK family T2SS minor pseudopilin variant LspK [Legionella pneumophila]
MFMSSSLPKSVASSKIRGSALLTALFIMTLVAIVATAMSTRLQQDIYRTRLVITQDKLYLASQAVTFWALNELLDKNNRFTKTNQLGMVAQYPKNMESIYNQVQLSGGIFDLQGRFNLNNLIEKKSIPTLMHLIGHIYSKATSRDRANMALGVKHWLLAYDLGRGEDIYTSYYLSQKPPYYPSHQLIKSKSEFRLIKDVSASAYLALEPFITALPESTSININTAPKQILMSLGDGLSEAQANELITARGENGITDLKEINELLKKFNIPSDQITIESQYYLSVAYAKNDEFSLVVYSLLKRSRDRKGKLLTSVIRESINNF